MQIETRGPSPWTVAVYMAGGECLNEDMIRGLRELRAASSEPNRGVRAMAQFDPKGQRSRFFDFTGESLARFLPSPAERVSSTSPFVSALANFEYVVESNDGHDLPQSSHRLREFAETARTASRQGGNLLVLSGHGSGAVGEFFGHRDLEPLHLREMAKALHKNEARTFDLVGMDCCNMAMSEVAYELRGCVEFLVASEGYVPHHGWPYFDVLTALPGRAPIDAAIEIVRRYLANYSDYQLVGVSSHCSACELRNIENLVEPVRELAAILTKRIEAGAWKSIVLAHWEAQSYKDEEYVDLVDFCERLAVYESEPRVQRLCEEVRRVVVDEVVVVNGFTGSRFQYSNGLSIYFPWSHDTSNGLSSETRSTAPLEQYRQLSFPRVTGWGRFLDSYLRATRRDSRLQPTHEPRERQFVPIAALAMEADARKERAQ